MNKRQRAIVEASEKGYTVKDDGRLISPGGRQLKLQLYENRPGRTQYYYFGSGSSKVKVHRLVAYQKFGKRIFEPGVQVRHLDDNSLNNSWDNIGIGTQVDNWGDKKKKQAMAS